MDAIRDYDAAHDLLIETVLSGTDAEKAAAARIVEEARDNLYRTAATMFAAAVAHFGCQDQHLGTPAAGYVEDEVWAKLAERLGVTAIMETVRATMRRADAAEKMARNRDSEVAGLWALVRKLEKRLDDLLPGVGEPPMVVRDAV